MSLTSELLPEPLTPVTQTNDSERKSTRRCSAGCYAGRRRSISFFLPRGRRVFGTAILRSPERYLPVRLRGLGTDRRRASLRRRPRRRGRRDRAEIDDVVGRPHRVFVVLDDDDRVPLIAQIAAGCRAACRCRGDAGRSTARRECRRRRPGRSRSARPGGCAGVSPPESVGAVRSSVEVIEPAAQQEPEPAADFLEDFFGDELLASASSSSCSKNSAASAIVERADFGQSRASDRERDASFDAAARPLPPYRLDSERRLTSTRSARCVPADSAASRGRSEQRDDSHVLFELPAAHRVVRLAVAVEQLGDDAVERAAVLPDAAAMPPGERDVPVAGAVQQQFCGRRRAVRARASSAAIPSSSPRSLLDAPRRLRRRCAAASVRARATCRAARRPLWQATVRRRGSAGRDRSRAASPRPLQSGHIPCGLLKLNSCGDWAARN